MLDHEIASHPFLIAMGEEELRSTSDEAPVSMCHATGHINYQSFEREEILVWANGFMYEEDTTITAKFPQPVLMARLRGLQQYAYKTHDGECMYNVQKADGKFAKVALPEVK